MAKKAQAKKTKKITRGTKFADILQNFPRAGEVLARDYGLHCIGCFASSFETLEEGCRAHGMEEKQIDKLVVSLNKLSC